MFVLYWIFTNGHKYQKEFESTKEAEAYAHLCDMFRSPVIDRVWIESADAAVWLREKN